MTRKLTKEDVWGDYETGSKGMIVARYGDECPIFEDIVPYKSVTVVCSRCEQDEVEYWLEYVHGSNSVSKTKPLSSGKVGIRSDYQCW